MTDTKNKEGSLEERYQKEQKGAIGTSFVSAISCREIVPVVNGGAISYKTNLSVGHLVGNIIFFVCGMAAGDATPNVLKLKKKGA